MNTIKGAKDWVTSKAKEGGATSKKETNKKYALFPHPLHSG